MFNSSNAKWLFITAWSLTQLRCVKLPRLLAKPKRAVFLFKLLCGVGAGEPILVYK